MFPDEEDVPGAEVVSLAGVPALLRYPPWLDDATPLIVLWHGFGPPGSEQALMEALPLDDVPAVKAYVGLPLFGRRLPPGGLPELARRQTDDYLVGLFRPVTEDAVAELPAVLDALCRHTGLPHEALGLFGFSAGGATALRALMDRPVAIRAAVAYNAPVSAAQAVRTVERVTGKPYRWMDLSRALAPRADALARARDLARGPPAARGAPPEPPPALLLLHGADDEYFGTEAVRALHAALQPLYEAVGARERLELRVVDGVSHHFGPPGAAAGPRQVPMADPAPIADAAGEWFRRWLF